MNASLAVALQEALEGAGLLARQIHAGSLARPEDLGRCAAMFESAAQRVRGVANAGSAAATQVCAPDGSKEPHE